VAKKTVGQVLRGQRAKLDMTLNAAEDLTQIQKMYIVALEHDDYDALPGTFMSRPTLNSTQSVWILTMTNWSQHMKRMSPSMCMKHRI
jgi:hypothetical protein